MALYSRLMTNIMVQSPSWEADGRYTYLSPCGLFLSFLIWRKLLTCTFHEAAHYALLHTFSKVWIFCRELSPTFPCTRDPQWNNLDYSSQSVVFALFNCFHRCICWHSNVKFWYLIKYVYHSFNTSSVSCSVLSRSHLKTKKTESSLGDVVFSIGIANFTIYKCNRFFIGARGSVVVEALCYKPEGRGIDTRWGEFLNLPNPSVRTRPWGLLSL
jgi:hypothetical protein